MTAPDPLECLNSRARADRPLCGDPDSAHCDGCQGCPGACTCRKPSPRDKEQLTAALDAYAAALGATNWAALTAVPDDLDEANLSGSYRTGVEVTRDLIAAAIAPLQDEICRLTAEVENLKHSKETS